MGYDDDWEEDDFSKPENPNAFPRPYSYDESEAFHYLAHPGMSLRDWFAGMFASQMVTTPDWNLNGRDDLAEDAYAFADAMLKERTRKKVEDLT